PDHRALVPTEEAEGVWVEGAPSSLIKEPEIFLEVAPERVPGYWYGRSGASPKPTQSPPPGEKAFYFFHAGASPTFPHTLPRALALEYRPFSTHPFLKRFPFPAALLDYLSGYNNLVEIGHEPFDIILVGTSAGDSALALCRLLSEKACSADFPAPTGNLLLLSPWVDVSHN
ncbi:hypothetical protein BD769DRAFT_1345710, partial [Suillus cothurnatus]